MAVNSPRSPSQYSAEWVGVSALLVRVWRDDGGLCRGRSESRRGLLVAQSVSSHGDADPVPGHIGWGHHAVVAAAV
jgi:hypothetical protein